MSIIAEVVRAHIVSGLAGFEHIPQMTYRGWIAKKSYKLNSDLKSKEFELKVYSHEEILKPLAYDINRMAASSFESMHGILPEIGLPKSVGWLVIRSYYSAYFAMHSILRLFGISCSQFDSNESNAITDVARMYSLDNGNSVSCGYYRCYYDFQKAVLYCKQLNNTHQDVWKTFYDFIDELTTKVASSDFRKIDRDYVLQYLFKLREGLSFRNTFNNGTWLSKVRNDVNYSHSMGAWYPYERSSYEHEEMFRLTKLWKLPPSEKTIHDNLPRSDHLLYVATCVSVVALCHSILKDLYQLNNNVFLKLGPVRLVNQLDGV